METNSKIKSKVEQTLSSVDHISPVNASPFFKEKVMQQIRNAAEDKSDLILTWFTPKLQFAALVCVVVLNVVALTKITENNYDENLSDFVESNGLSTSNETLTLSDL
ncbi:hypothetical protein [Winogradskyella flava]|uniref:hypothetical protein n=1 Tax=Winogradskyella flava TaxID=1884876 RepID=UPI002492193E|nr:hypothetical protein [Winogradskyella flava]